LTDGERTLGFIEHLRRDPGLFNRTFSHEEIYTPELGCHADESPALRTTSLGGAALLHFCVDNDEMEIARWMIARGADVNVKAAVDADDFARLPFDHGVDPNVRASLRKLMRFFGDELEREYLDVTPLASGERFHEQDFVSRPAMRMIAERGGQIG